MAKTIDISGKLTNERPVLKLAEGKEYPIDNRKNTVLELNKKLDNSDLNDLRRVDEALELVLGKEAVAEINASDLTFADYQTVFMAVLAGALGEEFETVEARFLAGRAAV